MVAGKRPEAGMHTACCNQRENGTNSFSGESKRLLQSGAKGEMPDQVAGPPGNRFAAATMRFT